MVDFAPQTTLLPAKFESRAVLLIVTLPFEFKTAVGESATPVARFVSPRSRYLPMPSTIFMARSSLPSSGLVSGSGSANRGLAATKKQINAVRIDIIMQALSYGSKFQVENNGYFFCNWYFNRAISASSLLASACFTSCLVAVPTSNFTFVNSSTVVVFSIHFLKSPFL